MCMAAMVLRKIKHIPPQVLLTGLGVPEEKGQIPKAPLSKNSKEGYFRQEKRYKT